ncbi:hypothetical protein [Undibacterium umbellatum]|uniref:Secreted protein n=1 Tax=Undibacterium umbellatum TaxID=2762300 RepID=A0ABR6Z9I1_9BURK|nr:hypothetical protein [Undibacterium umbellatum]MBC3907990.1 hypothetical protein [Undibacterium umbellatum]
MVGTICVIAIVVLTLVLSTVPESHSPALHGTATLTHVEMNASHILISGQFLGFLCQQMARSKFFAIQELPCNAPDWLPVP